MKKGPGSQFRIRDPRIARTFVACSAGILMTALAAPASASSPRPGRTERVSVASDGTDANGESGGNWPAISADGRYVVFGSTASNLVAGDTNEIVDIFVHDRVTRIMERVSIASDGTQANGASYRPFINADGRYVGFHSSATNLVPGDSNGTWDIFVRDRTTHVTERVSVATDGTQGNGLSYWPTISADGRYVTFDSRSSNLVAGDTNGFWDVFVHDRTTRSTERVTGTATNGGGQSVMSANGRYIAFESTATNPAEASTTTDIYVFDRATAVTERVSDASDGSRATGPSMRPSINADGRYIAFDSYASNLVPGDTNSTSDIFVRDRVSGITERISVTSAGTE